MKIGMPEAGLIATEKKKRRKRKKPKKTEVQESVERLREEDNSDDEEDEMISYLNISASSITERENHTSSKVALQVHSYESNHLDDPVSQTIALVVQKSNNKYGLDRVTACVNRMWDSGLAYDDVDAVLKELGHEDDKMVDNCSPPLSSPQPKQSNTAAVVEVTSQDMLDEKVLTASKLEVAEHEDSCIQQNGLLEERKPDGEMKFSQAELQVQDEHSITARLETAASHPDIIEALVALEAWCRVVGPDTSSRDFFQCQALEILLHQLVAQPSLMQNLAIKNSLLTLFSHIFPSPHGSTVNSSSLIFALEKFLSQLSHISALKLSANGEPSSIAKRLGNSLRAVHQVFVTNETKGKGAFSGVSIDENIEAAVEQVHSSRKKLGRPVNDIEPSVSNIRDVLEICDATRELLNLKLQKHLERAKETRTDNHRDSTKASFGICGSSSADKHLESSILAASGVSRTEIDNLKAQASSISNYYDRLSAENDAVLAPYRRDYIKCNETLSNLQQNYQYMQLQLKNIENEMNMVRGQLSSIQTDMSKIKLQQESRMNELTASHADVVLAIEKDKQVQGLLNGIRELEKSFDLSIHDIWEAQQNTPRRVDNMNPNEMRSLLEEYVCAELKCSQFLCNRYSLMKQKIFNLEREVAEYTNLGMKNLAADILKSMETLKENAEEDKAALQNVQDSISATISKVKLESGNEESGALSHQCVITLHKVVTCLQSAGIDLNHEMVPFIDISETAAKEDMPETANGGSNANGTTPNSDMINAPLPPRRKKTSKSSSRSSDFAPPPGLDAPSTSAQGSTSPWGGWGTIPKVTDPFKISK